MIFSNIEIVYLVFLVVKYFVVESIVVESIGLLLVEGIGEEGAVEDGAAEGEFVGVFDLVAHADAARQDSNFHIGVWRQAAENVEIGSIAFHGGTQGEDDLLDAASLDTFLEAIHLDIGRANAVHGRNESAQHMV